MLSSLSLKQLSFTDKEIFSMVISLQNKKLNTWNNLISLMNPIDYAYARINRYGMASCTKEGFIYEGEFVRINNDKCGIFIGNSLNPLVYRGENKEYPDFTPGLQRPNVVSNTLIRHIDGIKKLIFLDYFYKTPYYDFISHFNPFGLSYIFDSDAVAQHYGFLTNYIDITRNLQVALFFAYTYFEEGVYKPITDFEKYKPILYVGSIVDIYKLNPTVMKLISFQSVIRAYRQKAMALDCTNTDNIKSQFKKIILPSDIEFSTGIYEDLVGGEMISPTGCIDRRIFDPIGKMSSYIHQSRLIDIEYIDKYIFQQKIRGEILDKEWLINNLKKEFDIEESRQMCKDLDSFIKDFFSYMVLDVEKGIKPMLSRLSARFTAESLHHGKRDIINS